MSRNLAGQRIAILATDGFEQSELTEPHKALSAAGADVSIVSVRPGRIQGMQHHERGDSVAVTELIAEASPSAFAGLVLPGGVANPDELRTNQAAVAFARTFIQSGKPVGAICHGPWTLIEADVVRGRTVTSWPSLKTDLRNAGATWVDQEVVVDGNLVTSRKPADLPAFCRAFIDLLEGGTTTPNASGDTASKAVAASQNQEPLQEQIQTWGEESPAEANTVDEFNFSQEHTFISATDSR